MLSCTRLTELRPTRLGSLLAITAVTASGCGSVSSTTLGSLSLRGVRVSVEQAGVPPAPGGGGGPQVVSFSTPAQIAKVRRAMRSNQLAARASVAQDGCSGGVIVTLRLVRTDGGTETLPGYVCAGKSFGRIAGNLAGFLKAIGTIS